MMSGTSCDGTDSVLIEIAGRGAKMKTRLIGHRNEEYPDALRRRLLAVMCPAKTTTEELAALHADLGRWYAKAARRAMTRFKLSRGPDLVGSHGQTICHLPRRREGAAMLQIGEPAWIAAELGCPVVADFRQADLAAGGEAAPLVPWTDYVLLRHPRRRRAVQNIGGIANVTYLPAGATPADVVAFDTGPGNMIIDELVRILTHGRQEYDHGGKIAARGRVLPAILSRWMRHPFLKRTPPKSAGREQFGRLFVRGELPRLRAASRRSEDWVTTATAFTACSIADAYRRFLPSRRNEPAVDEVILCGGGAANATLRRLLAAELPAASVLSIEEFGIPIQAKEALSFAMLAAAFVDGEPANLPQVTGAKSRVLLGKLCLPPVTIEYGRSWPCRSYS